MARELAHASVGTDLSQTEWESINTHTLSGGAAGDVLYFDGTNIKGLAVGTTGQVLTVVAGLPAWSSTVTSPTINSPTITGAVTASGLAASPAIGANGALVATGGTITEAASGTHARLTLLELTAPTVTAGAATVTDTAVLYISGAMTATVTDTNYALWVDSGAVQFDSTLGVGSTLTVQGGGVQVQAGGITVQSGGINVQAAGISSTGGVTLATGNLTFSTTGQRITGDFSNGTHASRVMVQTSTVNGNTVLGIIANGTASITQHTLYAGSDPANATVLQVTATTTGCSIASSQFGTGTNQPLSFNVAGVTLHRLHVSGGASILDATDPGAGILRVAGIQHVTGAVSIMATYAANTKSTLGLTINQGGADDEILSLKSSDVAHGMTAQTETATYGYASKYSSTSGGVRLAGFSSGTTGTIIDGFHTTDDTAKSNVAAGALIIRAALKSSTTVTDIGANANILAVRNNGTTRFILDGDGDSHQDVGTAWTNFDDHDDLALLNATAALLDPGNLRQSFNADFLAVNRQALTDSRVVAFNPDGHHFINWSRFHMLHMGATRYLGDRVAELEAEITELKGRLALVGG